MIPRDRFISLSSGISKEALSQLSIEFSEEMLSGDFREFFERLEVSLPKFSMVLRAGYRSTVGARSTRFGNHVAGVFLESVDDPGRVLFGEFWPTEVLDAHSPASLCHWLPPSLRGWYEFTDGFQWGRWETGRVGKAIDFPTTYAGRFSVEEYCESQGLARSSARVLYRRVGSDSLQGWIYTEGPQALFVDEGSVDGRLYHVRGRELEDVVLINHPEIVLDRYLTSLVEQGSSPGFDFRAADRYLL